jgi:hypothetical protein
MPIVRQKKECQQNILIVYDAVEGTSSIQVCEEDHRAGNQLSRLSVKNFDDDRSDPLTISTNRRAGRDAILEPSLEAWLPPA